MAGQKKTVSDKEILQAFEDSDDPVLGAQEVAKEINMSRQGAGERLRQLVDEGQLERKKPGSRTAVYWLPSGDC